MVCSIAKFIHKIFSYSYDSYSVAISGIYESVYLFESTMFCNPEYSIHMTLIGFS
jgi:hypothetical protein